MLPWKIRSAFKLYYLRPSFKSRVVGIVSLDLLRYEFKCLQNVFVTQHSINYFERVFRLNRKSSFIYCLYSVTTFRRWAFSVLLFIKAEQQFKSNSLLSFGSVLTSIYIRIARPILSDVTLNLSPPSQVSLHPCLQWELEKFYTSRFCCASPLALVCFVSVRSAIFQFLLSRLSDFARNGSLVKQHKSQLIILHKLFLQ